MTDRTTDEFRAARDKVEAAIAEYAALESEHDDDEYGSVMLLGWAVSMEYTSTSTEERSQTVVQAFASNTQSRATTRGLLEFGAEKYSMHDL